MITAVMPRRGGVSFISASDGGDINGSNIIWTIPELAGNGTSISVSYDLEVTATDGFLTFKDYVATADEWLDPVGGTPISSFWGRLSPFGLSRVREIVPHIFSAR